MPRRGADDPFAATVLREGLRFQMQRLVESITGPFDKDPAHCGVYSQVLRRLGQEANNAWLDKSPTSGFFTKAGEITSRHREARTWRHDPDCSLIVR